MEPMDGPGRVDFTALEDATRERRVAAVVAARVAPVLSARRAGRGGAWLQLLRWRRPVVAAAGLLAAASLAVIVCVPGSRSSDAGASRTAIEASGAPGVIANWAERGQVPDASDLATLAGR